MNPTLPEIDLDTRMPYVAWRVAVHADGTRTAAEIAAATGTPEPQVLALVQGIRAALNGQRPASAVELQAVRGALVEALGPMGALFLEDAFDALGTEHPPLGPLLDALAAEIDDPGGRARFTQLLSSKGLS